MTDSGHYIETYLHSCNPEKRNKDYHFSSENYRVTIQTTDDVSKKNYRE